VFRVKNSESVTGVGSVLRLIRAGEAVTRAELARRTGLSRSTVAQRVDALLAHELVYEAGGSASTGGRPPTVLAFNREAGVVLAADLGATHSRLAVADLAGAPLAET
jgi:predicted ArsR family transcriptional regulator